MPHLSSRTLRSRMGATLRRVSRNKERIILSERGRDVAVLMPIDDVALIEKLEDRIDTEEAMKVLTEMKAKGEKPIPWEKVKGRLGL